MAAGIHKKVFKSFPLILLALLICLMVLQDQYKVLGMFFLMLFFGISLRFFKFKGIFLDAAAKLAFILIIYLLLRLVFTGDIGETALYFISGIAVMFFGNRAYECVNKHLFLVSFISMFLCIIIFSIYRNAQYDKNLLDIVVPIVVGINIIILYFANNDDEISHASKSEQKSKSKMIKSNKILVVITLVIAAVASLFNKMVEFFENIINSTFNAVGRFITAFITMILAKTDSTPGDGVSELDFSNLPAGDKEPSTFFLVLQYFFYVLAALIGLIVMFFLFKKLFALLKKLLNYLMKLNFKETPKTTADYEDEVESDSIMNVAGISIKNAVNRIISANTERYKSRTIREEIRYQYKLKVRKLKKKGLNYNPAYTAYDVYEAQNKSVIDKDKVIKQEFVGVYNIARYSDNEINANYIEI